jgi:hypothetical protein
MANTHQSDQLVMLLSADWFALYWPTFGLVFSASEQEKVREISRRLIKELLKGSDTYWGANFSDARISATRSFFLADLRREGLAGAVVSQLTDTLNAVGESAQFATTLWFFSALCDQVGGSTDAPAPLGVSGAGFQTVKSLWQLSVMTEPDGEVLENALMASDTHWDRFLRNATPDLPTYLPDWAMTRLHKPKRFRRFWAQLFWSVSQSDRRSLKTWLEEEAMKLADPSFSLTEPAWMRVE